MPLAASDPVRLELRGSVAHVQLNRPQAANAMNLELLDGLRAALLTCHGDRRVRAVLLTGAGANFCAGGDVREFAAQRTNLDAHLRNATALLHAATTTMINLQAPVITAVQGHAAGGGGIGLVCSSDIVLAGESARFIQGAIRVGMVPDAGSTVTLTRLIGQRRALELALTNRALDAQEALALGLINEVVPDAGLAARALELAEDLAQGPTRALAAAKRLIWHGAGRSIEDAYVEEARTQAELGATSDALEGLAAVIERREPHFAGV
ncbi:MAG: enoyl-CoA hydratase/isomerase family protein [Solirubrobacteraceae bacterium]